jgi:phosphate starvation-inducible PhoH-like protein
MAKKSRKRDIVDKDLKEEESILIHELENTHKKELFCNFRILNKFKLNDVHETFMNLCLYKDTKMIFVDGPAGSGKSYLAVYAALKMLQNKEISQIVYIRSIVESASKSLGSLPGEVGQKFEPFTSPMIEKLEELVGPKVGGELMNSGFIKCIPVNFVRGLTFRDSVVIIDETQNFSKEEIISCITRFGENTKFILIGDSYQADIGNKSGFSKIRQIFDDEESQNMGIHNFIFTENEIVRSKILKFLVKKLEAKV